MRKQLTAILVITAVAFGTHAEASNTETDVSRYVETVKGSESPEKLARGKTIRYALWTIANHEAEFSASDYAILRSARESSSHVDYQLHVEEIQLAIQLCSEHVLDRDEKDVDPVSFARALSDGEEYMSRQWDDAYEALIVNLSAEGKRLFEDIPIKVAQKGQVTMTPKAINQAVDYPDEMRKAFIASCEASKSVNVGESARATRGVELIDAKLKGEDDD